MRKGFNPYKDQAITKSDFFHQVIVPVYIPNQQGYFKDSFQILKYCLESLFITSHSKTYFTVVNNGSCTEVIDYLNILHKQGKIHEVIHVTAIGKLNAILKGVSGNEFDLITVSDADVLFLDNWQKATYDVFEAFPKTGVVSTTPNPKMLRYYTSNVLFGTLFSKRTQFTKVKNKIALNNFAKSIDNPDLFKPIHLEYNLTVSNKDVKALVGAGHFVATYRGICFDEIKNRYSKFSLGGNSEQLFLDKPAINLGLWRLSTEDNFTYHLGNIKESWMEEKRNNLKINYDVFSCIELKSVTEFKFSIWFKREIVSRILFRKPIWQLFLRLKGLPKEETSNY